MASRPQWDRAQFAGGWEYCRGFLGNSVGKASACSVGDLGSIPGSVSSRQSICLQSGRPGCNSWVGKFPWRRKWQPTPVFLPGEAYGQRSLAGYSLWDHQESDTTKCCLCVCVGPLLTLECLPSPWFFCLLFLETCRPGTPVGLPTHLSLFLRRRNGRSKVCPPPLNNTNSSSFWRSRTGQAQACRIYPKPHTPQPIMVTIAVTFLAIILAAPDQSLL